MGLLTLLLSRVFRNDLDLTVSVVGAVLGVAVDFLVFSFLTPVCSCLALILLGAMFRGSVTGAYGGFTRWKNDEVC